MVDTVKNLYWTVYKLTSNNEESNSTANSNGRKFLYNSKGFDASSLLVKYIVGALGAY